VAGTTHRSPGRSLQCRVCRGLGFDLLGRYVENGQSSDIFGFRFTSPEEYHYLFAQTSEDILQDSCPVEWVGSRIVTPLRENRAGIVPDRLRRCWCSY